MQKHIHLTSHSQLGTGSAFFLDYLSHPEKISKFFPGFHSQTLSVENLTALAPGVAARHARPPSLIEALRKQNVSWGAHAATLKNIDLLSDSNSVVIIGGQQAGLFGGAALSVYKALTTIRLAEEVTKAGVPTAPIFWVASEDHDFAEVSHTAFIGRDGARAELRYKSDFKGFPSVGEVLLGAGVTSLHDELSNILPETEFTSESLMALRDCYRDGVGWCDAFAAWMLRLFSRFGLIVVDPRDPTLKKLSSQIYGGAIARADEIANQVVIRSRELENDRYHAQVAVTERSVLLFIENEQSRVGLTQNGEFFQVKNSTERFTKTELLSISETSPDRLSPNALLRPIVQDALFPTIAHVVGPAEIAYLAQSQPIYEMFNMPPPVRWHRSSVTLVEPRQVKTLEKYGLKFEDIALGEAALIRRVVTEAASGQALGAFADAKANINAQLDHLGAILREKDPPLADALHRGREKILYQIDGLETRFIANRAQGEDALRRQIERMTTALYPNRVPQERDINFLFFLARYGGGLIERLHNEMYIDPAHHQWLTI